MFDSDENAIVDFKYAASEKLTWWFDHHESAFLTPEDEAHFRADTSGQKFLDATRKSCTEFIADVARERFGFDTQPIETLVHWAHVIDGALYESPAQCVELKEPALQLMQVIESDPDDHFIEQIIREDRKSTRLNSSHGYISYAVFCLKKKKNKKKRNNKSTFMYIY